MVRIVTAAVLLMLAVPGCLDEGRDEVEAVSDNGTVVFLTFEGGFYGIQDDHGRRWDPSNLPEDFRSDSLRVHFEGIQTYVPTYHMWGSMIELTEVSYLR